MARINKLIEQLQILKKYIKDESEYDISSFENETNLIVNVGEVSESDKLKLEELGAFYDDGNKFWFVG